MSFLLPEAAKAGAGRRRIPSRGTACLCGLAAAAGLCALLISPLDLVLSHSLRISRESPFSLLWQAAQVVKLFGKGDILIVIGLALAIYRRKQVAIAACIAMIIAGLIVAPTKVLVERPRPSGKDMRSFPSGDAAAVAAFAVPVVAAFPSSLPVAAAGIAAIGMARVAMGYHFPSDVLAGIAIGFLSGALVLYFRFVPSARIRRLLRRSWCAAALGLFILIRPMTGGEGTDLRQFLSIFGPALVLLAGAPFLRAGLRTRGRAASQPGRRSSRATALAVAVVILAGFLFVTTRSTLWDRDEPRFSEATLEMIHSGDYLVPTFRGQLRADKPILIYWLMSLPVRVFGPTELACRFFASVGAAAACFLSYLMAFPFLGPAAGLLSMMILATSPLLLTTGTAATTDAVLLATIVGAFAVFENGFRKGLRKIHILGFTLTLGAALLTKGPVGLALPILGMVLILILSRRFSYAWAGYLFASSVLALAVFLGWAIPANDATGGEFFRRGVGYHMIARAVRPLDSHGGNFFLTLPYYIPVVIFAFFPWILFLPGALSAVAGNRVGGSHGRSLLLGWMIPTFLFMSLVSTKLPHYILPIWPALALAVGGSIEAAERGGLAPRDLKWFGYGRWLFAAIGMIGGAALVLGPWFVPAFALNPPGAEPFSPGLAWPITGLGALLLIMTILAVREHSAGRYRSTAGILAAGMVCVIFTVSIFGLPMMEKFKLSKPLADAIRARTAEDVQVSSLDYDEPSLIFYLGRRHLKPIGGDGGVLPWARQPQPGVLVISREALKRVELRDGPLGLKQIAAIKGYNYSKGRWADIVALGRNLP